MMGSMMHSMAHKMTMKIDTVEMCKYTNVKLDHEHGCISVPVTLIHLYTMRGYTVDTDDHKSGHMMSHM